MKHFRYSLLAIACATTYLPATIYAAETAEASAIERITVYGRQNQVVMN